MTPEEHLQRIRQRCVELLAIAEKRTPGKWDKERQRVFPQNEEQPITGLVSSNDDAAFIAACAGSTEAGWRSTITLIDVTLALKAEDGLGRDIIAAWPEELL